MVSEEDKPLTPRELKAQQKQDWSDAVAEWASKGLIKDKVYIGKSDTHKAWVYVLETGNKGKIALEYVALETGKSETWVEDVKNNRVHPDILKSVMLDTGSHPTMVAMKDKEILDTSTKRALKSASSINSVLNTLSNKVTLNQRIDNLEQRVDNLESAFVSLVEQVGCIKEVQDSFQGQATLTKEDKKLLAGDLKNKGLTGKQIASKLDVPISTVYRWLK